MSPAHAEFATGHLLLPLLPGEASARLDDWQGESHDPSRPGIQYHCETWALGVGQQGLLSRVTGHWQPGKADRPKLSCAKSEAPP